MARRILAHSTSLIQMGDSGSQESDLDEFSSYLALESWTVLSPSLQSASHFTRGSILTDIDDLSLDATSIPFVDTLISYGFVPDHEEALQFLRNTIADYIEDACAAPPPWSATRTQECEICEREVPLTYHHLIPRAVHAKVLKKRWHPEEMLNSVAWLCRPCHSMVHSVAKNEELAKEYHTVALLLKRDDIAKWKFYAAKQRFGVRRG
ncbi:hypothetical protein BDZ94DRAFT_1250423 [Collybia nuda]|uniref:HNH domain-containing protein n=1 Tax=Collybia nuda TaxID=64659 RepID=A0A9P6CNH4_9AGAR|nr:hypothetical protein BDZ94DRAFT_1250423 [Collybia nuda]